ncbi:MAG: peptidoglycan-binding protein [Gomphosphaeria aponina SAG 52.96 = DSM 107014]|uniref:Peptidoglycan-binding protein n=1 Tax=Gomphosphaeria aponina SAG 52.96 = DSM 107014 TaxID=1521640 RepID=A0A941GPM1_9CHRO|nr:peptidoglycan-binding protein [Gomphosphaeria aponina SAG 52.96 = DSM 107014]
MNLSEFYNAKLEYSPEAIYEDIELAKNVQTVLIGFQLLEPPADGKFGPISTAALLEFQKLMGLDDPSTGEPGFMGPKTAKLLIETKADDPRLKPKVDIDGLNNSLASRIIKYMKQKNYVIALKPKEYNIVYVEGMNPDGKLNADEPDHFNDVRIVIEFDQGQPKIIGIWEATTEPGKYYTVNPMNPKGAARIEFGQYKAWQVGTHGNAEPHEALVQKGEVTVCRDLNQDMVRTGDKRDTGYFGINQHYGYDYPRTSIKKASAGCLVGRTREGHKDFMAIIKQDQRYQKNKDYLFYTTIIPGDDLEQKFPSS